MPDVAKDAGNALAEGVERAKSAAGTNLYLIAMVVASLIVLVVLYKRGSLSRKALRDSVRDVHQHNAVIWFVCGGLVWVAAIVAAGAAMGISGMQTGVMFDTLKAQVVLVGASYGGGIAVGALLVYLLHTSANESGLHVTFASLFKGLAAMALAWPIVAIVGTLAAWMSTLISGERPSSLAHPTLTKLVENPDDIWAWSLALLAVVGAPIQEEIIYRACIQSGILRLTGNAAVSVIVTSLLFASAHVVGSVAVPWHAAVTLFCLSLMFGYAFERTGKLGVPIAMHIAFNAVNVGIAISMT